MYGLEYGKGVVHCSFCGKQGHNITSCNHVVNLYNNTEYVLRTCWPDGTLLPEDDSRPWVLLENWWELSKKEQMAWIEMTNREKRQAKRKARNQKKRTQRCSFCRKEGHRRPSCKHHKKFTKTIYKANKVWREQFVDLVNITGIGLGALVEVPKSTVSWWADSGECLLCLVVGYSLESLNVFSSYRNRDDFRTVPHLILTDTTTGDDLKLSFDKVKPFVDSGLVFSRWSTSFLKVISPVRWNPKDNWTAETYNQEIEYVLKKLSVVDDNFPL